MKRLCLTICIAALLFPVAKAQKADLTLTFAETYLDVYISDVAGYDQSDNAKEILTNNLTIGGGISLSDIEFTSSDETVATVDENGEIYPLKPGEITITASFAGNDTYNEATASYTLFVSLLHQSDGARSSLLPPILLDEANNLLTYDYITSDHDGDFQTYKLTVEYDRNYTIFYKYESGTAGEETDKQNMEFDTTGAEIVNIEGWQLLPMEYNETYKISEGVIYPYGSENGQWQGGTITLYAASGKLSLDEATALVSQYSSGSSSISYPLELNFSIPTKVTEIEADANSTPTYYNLQGVRVTNPNNGIFIKVQDGKAKTILVTK